MLQDTPHAKRMRGDLKLCELKNEILLIAQQIAVTPATKLIYNSQIEYMIEYQCTKLAVTHWSVEGKNIYGPVFFSGTPHWKVMGTGLYEAYRPVPFWTSFI